MSTNRRVSRSSKGGFRKHGALENVIVEEPFTFSRKKWANDNASNTAASTDANEKDIPENNDSKDEEVVGHGCYVSCTTTSQGSKRYYGVLIEQSVLSAASEMYLQDEASSLELNRRMEVLLKQRKSTENPDELRVTTIDDKNISQNVPSCDHNENTSINSGTKDERNPNQTMFREIGKICSKKVEQFQYVPRQSSLQPGYRVLLATYANVEAASQFQPENNSLIRNACDSGGDWVGSFYYQYEVKNATLVPNSIELENKKRSRFRDQRVDIHTSMGTSHRQSNVMNMFNIQAKRSASNNIDTLSSKRRYSENSSTKHAVTGSRNAYKIAIIGGGIAGFSCAHQLLQDAEAKDIPVEVELFEAKSQYGGRICSDKNIFKVKDSGEPIPIDLGSQFIHGITENPLIDLCNNAKLNVITKEETMKMLGGNMVEIDDFTSNKTERIFNELLDSVVTDVWNRGDDFCEYNNRNQHAIRWYGSVFTSGNDMDPKMVDVPSHRYSSDSSFEYAVGERFYKLVRDHEDISVNQAILNLLRWEHSLGANIDSLSIKYFNSDEEYNFEGGHAHISEGYAELVSYLQRTCENYKNFSSTLNAPVSKILYARSAMSYPMFRRDRRRAIDVADACQVVFKDGAKEEFDFIVCTVPLGVLKESVSYKSTNNLARDILQFEPPLPSSKIDAIHNVGFGLVNKIFLEFDDAFWRVEEWNNLQTNPYLSPSENAFANASKVFPEYFTFKDIGRMKFPNHRFPPAILMTMVSGREAVRIEQTPDEDIKAEVMATLRSLYSDLTLKDPIKFKVTRWGSDVYARGCYTFLPPGCTDQDYTELAKPLTGIDNVEEVESSLTFSEDVPIHRLFFAGEHTSESHPSTAHGAYLSGQQTALLLLDEIFLKNIHDATVDEHIPLASYRFKFPDEPLRCQLCRLQGNRKREGDLYGFRRGTKYALAHYHCASFCPAVDFEKSGWKNIVSEIHRGKYIHCAMCGRSGASIGCSNKTCVLSFHYTCAKLSGWNFMRRGREFFCGSHQHEGASSISGSSDEESDVTDTDYIKKPPLYSEFSSTLKSSQHNSNSLEHILFTTLQSHSSRNRLSLSVCSSSNSSEKSSEDGVIHINDQDNFTKLLIWDKDISNASPSSLDLLVDIRKTHPVVKEISVNRNDENKTWGICMELRTESNADHTIMPRTLLVIYAFDERHGLLLRNGDLILRINGISLGCPMLKTWRQIIDIVDDVNKKSLSLTVARKENEGVLV